MADYTYDQFDAEQERQRARFGETRRMSTGTGGDIVPYDQANPPTPPNREVRPTSNGGTPLDAVQQGIDSACSLYRRYPNTMSNLAGRNLLLGGRGIFGSNQENGDRLLRFVCGYDPTDLPQPSLPFQNGQCAGVLYDIRYTITGTEGGNPRTQTNVPNALGVRLYGPIVGPDVQLVSTGRYDHGILGRNVAGEVQRQPVFLVGNAPTTSQWRLTSFVLNSVTRVGGGASCGDPPRGYPPETAPPFNPRVRLPSGNTEIEIPVTIGPRPGGESTSNPQITIDVGGIDVNIDIGGISFGGTPSGGLTPAQEQTINNTNNTVNTVNNTVNEVASDLTEVLARLDALSDQIDNGFDSISEALDCIELLVKRSTCDVITKKEGSSTVGTFQFTREDGVEYCNAARPKSAFLLIEVLDPLPRDARAYKLTGNPEDIEVGFGNYSIYRQVVGAATRNNDTFQRLYTKYTVVKLDNEDFLQGLRLSCVPGTLVTVTDLGYVYEPQVIDCIPEGGEANV